jgi:hypothetical protein
VTVEDWWLSFIFVNGTRRKSLASLIMLTSWEIWNERNSRVLRKVSTMLMVVVAKTKREAALWSAAGATHLGSIMPRE